MVTPDAANQDALLARARQVAADVPDPELPCLTIGELGMVAGVRLVDSASTGEGADTLLEVDLTPTYTGCPAVQVIEASVVVALREAGLHARVRRVLSPPWSTDRISASGRAKMRANGIAPPQRVAPDCAEASVAPVSRASDNAATVINVVATLFQEDGKPGQQPTVVACPHCGAAETRKVSVFGSTPCKSQYQCDHCHEPFEYFKCH